jgi:hypothetical protein
MHTSHEAVQLLTEALNAAQHAKQVIDDLIVEHDYQDVASLVTSACIQLIESAALLMQSDDEGAFDRLSDADDILDAVYAIIDAETDEDD